MDLLEQDKIKKRMSDLVTKWKDNVPTKYTNEWWRYRVDQSLYIYLREKLKKSGGKL